MIKWSGWITTTFSIKGLITIRQSGSACLSCRQMAAVSPKSSFQTLPRLSLCGKRFHLLWKFKHQHWAAAGQCAGNQASQTVWGGARVEQAIPHKDKELVKLCFGEDD